MKASDIMSHNPVTVSPDHAVRHATQIMLEHKISGLPVVDDAGRVVGILTEGDLLSRSELGIAALADADRKSAAVARHYVKANGWRVGDVMRKDPIVVDVETPVSRIAELMALHAIKRVPVLLDGRLVGIVSRADLLPLIAAAGLGDMAPGEAALRCGVLARLRETECLAGADITATLSNGVVHLWGDAPSREAVEAARVVVETIRGVEGVASHLAVKP